MIMRNATLIICVTIYDIIYLKFCTIFVIIHYLIAKPNCEVDRAEIVFSINPERTIQV